MRPTSGKPSGIGGRQSRPVCRVIWPMWAPKATSWKELVAFGAHIGQITLHTGRDCLPPIPEGFPDVGRMAPAYVHLLRVYDHDAARFCLSQLYLEQIGRAS